MGRRANQEGSIYRRTDGKWCAAITMSNGKQKVAYAKTKDAARQKLAELVKLRDQGLLVGTDRQTLAQYMDDWLENSVKPSVRPRTYESYHHLTHLHIIPALGKLTLGKLTPQHVQAFLNDKLNAGLSPRTVQYLRAVLRRALNRALRWALVARNVATLVDPPKAEEYEARVLTLGDVRRFLAALEGERLEALFVVALASGLRQGEALGLRWPDVDFDHGTLTVGVALQRLNGQYELVEPKTRKSKRTVPLPSVALAMLREHRKRQMAERLQAGGLWQDRWDLVFTTDLGAPLHYAVVAHTFHKLLDKAGIEKMRFHDLRHSSASLLGMLGFHQRAVMDRLGHTTTAMTTKYTHSLPDVHWEMAEKMDALLRGARG